MCDISYTYSNRNGIKQDQIPEFLADLKYRDSKGKPALTIPKDRTLYAMWIGTNDLGNDGWVADQQTPGLPMTAYTNCVFDQLDRLYKTGARNFLIMNNAPLDYTPMYARPENGGLDTTQFWPGKSEYNSNITQISEKMREYTFITNEVFDNKVPNDLIIKKRYPHSHFTIYDVHTLVRTPTMINLRSVSIG
jgi:hypothetical protein